MRIIYRSKHSLLDIPMVEIETAFNPPDVTDDMYIPSGDQDWHKWLAELMMDDIGRFNFQYTLWKHLM